MNQKNKINIIQHFSNLKYYFIAAAVATAIAGIVHLYMPLVAHLDILKDIPNAPFFLGSGIAQLFWVIPMIRRWGKVWYYIGIAGNIALIILYIVIRFQGNPVNGKGDTVDIIDLICELAQVAYIVITSIIIAKEHKVKIAN